MRNRSEGWKHAKLSGHKNEELIHKKLIQDKEFKENICKRMGKGSIVEVRHGGLKEKSVPSILGGVTKSKTDLVITWEDGSKSKISIKKSGKGQVFLIKTSRFIKGYQEHFGPIPETVKKGLMLYFGEDINTKKILDSKKLKNCVSDEVRVYEKYKNRLIWESLKAYDGSMANETIDWIKNNIDKIAIFCFARGLAKNEDDWADHIWYKNLLEEEHFDDLISIESLTCGFKRLSHKSVLPGNRTGGSTIQLPFGFLQWHQESMQFHHDRGKILKALL
jgi:hypothetical protein